MAVEQPSQGIAAARPPQASSEARSPVLTLIEGLEQKALSAASPEAMTADVLDAAAVMADALYGAFWRGDRDRDGAGPAFEQLARVSEQAARGWAPVLRELAAGAMQAGNVRYRAVSEPADRLMTGQRFVALAMPVRAAPPLGGCITLVVRQSSPILTDSGLAMLRLLAVFPLLYSASRTASNFEKSYQSLSAAWAIVGEMLAFTHPNDQAQVAVNRAKNTFHAERVTIGFADHGKATVAAISGEDVIDKRSNAVQLIRAAQMEVVVSGEPGRYSASAQDEERLAQTSRNPQHERLARNGGAKSIVSLPLRREKDIVAVWTFEFGENGPTEEDRQVMEVAAGQIGPALHLALQNSRNLWQRGRDLAESGVQWTFGKEHPWRRAAVAAGVLLLLFAILCPWPFKVAGACTMEPSFRRVYGAPFDTTIKAAPVRPGDTVEPGQTLIEFDRQEVEMQLREARSERASAEKKMLTYLTEEKVSEYAEAKARLDALTAQVELLEKHLDKTTAKADFAGVIITGDLKQDIGRTVRLGQELIELAPLKELRLEVEIEQGDVAFVQEGQRGEFTTKARPGAAMPFVISRLRPMPEPRKNATIYIAEATVENSEGWLRPGMEGAAKVSIGWRNVTWVATRKALNWLRFHVWWQ